MSRGYPVSLNWNEEDRGFHVRCRDLPEVLTAGATTAAALENAADALVVAIEGKIEDEDLVPEPSKPRSGEQVITLPAQLAAKAAVYRAWRETGITKAELAKKLGVAEDEARRILNPRYGTQLDRLEAVLAALGQKPSSAPSRWVAMPRDTD